MKKIRITINEKEIVTPADKTILEVVREKQLDEIPTLCYDKRLEHFTSCFLCVVEIDGSNKLLPSCSTKVYDGMKIKTRSEKVIESRKMCLELLMSNHYADCIGPCKNDCPAGVDAQAYISLISFGKYEEALKLVKQNNPLPLSIGRVCVRNCEAACTRNNVDEPVAVNALKRFIADEDAIHKWKPVLKEKKEKKIAVIGGGPAGLSCAYYLTVEGYSVTIFEKLPKLGGMLRYGIPEYRLPKKILDSEIDWIINLGIEVRTNVSLGLDFGIKDLMRSGYDALFVAVGAHKASGIGLEGEDNTGGVYRGIDFLRDMELKSIPNFRGKVIVVGGGNTAIDAARTAVRCGAEEVKIVYRRSIKEMPAHYEEIESAQKEGAEILFLTNPKSLISENGKIKAMECLKMKLEECRPGERPKPVPLPGSEFVIPCDYLIGAIGQSVDTLFNAFDFDCTLEKRGTVCVDKDTLETSIRGVFAGGDVVTGPFNAITAIAQGKKAAKSIMDFLLTGHAHKSAPKFYSLKHNLSKPGAREFDEVKKLARQKMNELMVSDRVQNFLEVEKGFSENQVQLEAGRCMECGCSEYIDCKLRKYCDEYNINISGFTGETKKYIIDRRHPFIQLDPNKCINCGKCVRTCAEILKVSALGFVYRGFKSIVKPAMEKSLKETNCIGCGNCVDVCPTGAISEKYPFKILGTLPKENVETVCCFCSVGCKVNFKKISDDIFYISNSIEEMQEKHNMGYLCSKGRFGYRYLYGKNRILGPVIKRNGLAQRANEEEVLAYIKTKVESVMLEYGNDSVAVFASPKLSNEELYLLQKFTRIGLKNNNISSFTHMLFGIEQNCLDDMIGFTTSTASMAELQNANVIVVVNSNLSDENLVMELKIKAAQKKGAKLILISSIESELTKSADLWIDSKKGTNALLMNALMKHLFDLCAYDSQFVAGQTNNFHGLKEMLDQTDIEQALNYIGIDKTKFEMLVNQLGEDSSNIIFVYNIDSTYDKSIHDLKAIGNYLLLCGRIAKPNNGIIVLREHNNSVGAMEMGAVLEYLPGYVRFDELDEIDRIEKTWETEIKSIFKPVDLAKKLKRGGIKAVLIFGEDPFRYEHLRKYFGGVEFLFVCDSYSTDTIKEADVVLPAATHIEQDGTYFRCDNTVQSAKQIVAGFHQNKNWQLISSLASHFSTKFRYNSFDDLLDEIKTVDRFYKYMDKQNCWLENYFNNGFRKQKFSFIKYKIDLSTFDPVKPVITYPENYYFSNVKKKLV